jgi:hypothetical protein
MSAAMAGASLHLMTELLEFGDRIPTPVCALLGVVLTLSITGIVAYPGFAFSLWKLLPDSYYRVTNLHRLAGLARVMGMGLFRAILMAFYWGHGRNRAKFFDGTRRGLEALDVETRRAEFGHLLAGLLVLLAATWLALREVRVAPGTALLSNVLMNVYPIVLQRGHRGRLTPLLRRLRSEGIS